MSSLYTGKADERDDDPARQFVNGISVGISFSAVNFDLHAFAGQADPPEQVWRFTTTPARFRTFHARLGKAIESYRAQFGEIPSVDPDEGPEETPATPDGEHG